MEVIDAEGKSVAAEDLVQTNVAASDGTSGSSVDAGTMANVHGLGAVAQATHKVSLERYRTASRRIFSIFVDLLGDHSVEKASIDEAFLDVTDLVDGILSQPAAAAKLHTAHQAALEYLAVQGSSSKRHENVGQDPPAEAPPHGADPTASEHSIDKWLPAPPPDDNARNSPPPLYDWCVAWPRDADDSAQPPPAAALLPVGDGASQRLLLAAHVAATCRREVWRRLGFTCSGGVAHNKMLAKLASARNKPNQQTLVPASTVLPLLRNLPLGDLRHLGGKLGASVSERWGVQTAGELQAVPFEAMVSALGEKTGPWVWGAVRGHCEEEVRVGRTATKSMLAAKSFRATQGRDMAAVASWMRMLAADLGARMVADAAQNGRTPRTLSVYWRRADVRGQAMRSKSGPMPPRTRVAASEIAAWRAEQQIGTAGSTDNPIPPGGEGETAPEAADGAVQQDDESTDVEDAASDGDDAEGGSPPQKPPRRRASEDEHPPPSTPQAMLHQRVLLLERAAMALLGTLDPREVVPCTRLALAASSFSDTAVPQGQKRLAHFFGASGGTATVRQAAAPASDVKGGSDAAASAQACTSPDPPAPQNSPPPAADAAGSPSPLEHVVVDISTSPQLLHGRVPGPELHPPSLPSRGGQEQRSPPAHTRGESVAATTAAAARGVSVPSSSGWRCSACTLVNSVDARLCSACGAWAPHLRSAGGGTSATTGRPSQPSIGHWLQSSSGVRGAVQGPKAAGATQVQSSHKRGIRQFLSGTKHAPRSKKPAR